MGVVIAPPVPAFYNQPKTIDEIVSHTASRLLDLFDIQVDARRWDGVMGTGRARPRRAKKVARR